MTDGVHDVVLGGQEMDFETIGTPSQRQTFDAVWARLDEQLTGNAAYDLPILKHYLDACDEICLAPSDLRTAIIGVMMGYRPDGASEQFAEVTDFVAHRAGLEMSRAKEAADSGDFNEAMHIMTRLMSRINLLFKRFQKSTIFDFRDDFDAFTYRHANYVEGMLYLTPFAVSQGHQFIGKLYLKLNDIERAIAALRCAVAWNPVCAGYYFDLASAYYQRRDFKMHASNTSIAYRYLRTADDYRRFYFETARQFDNEADHKFAAEMYKLSLAFGENPRARGSLEYIEKTWFKCATPPLSLDHLKASCREHNISFGPSLNFMCDVDEYIAKIPENALSNSLSAEKQSVLAVWNSIV